LAEDLIARFKGLFQFSEQIPISDRTASTVAIVNNVKVEAFPSYHVGTMRGLDNVKFILSDETDYYMKRRSLSLTMFVESRAILRHFVGLAFA
jgi:hypothetical protein